MFTITAPRPLTEPPDAEYPFVLSTFRRLYHYHSRTMTGRVKGLNDLLGCEWMDINPADAETLGIKDGETVRVTSRRSSIKAFARVTDHCVQGVVFMDFHFAESPVNLLTNPAHDPIWKVPEFKAAAVKIERL